MLYFVSVKEYTKFIKRSGRHLQLVYTAEQNNVQLWLISGDFCSLFLYIPWDSVSNDWHHFRVIKFPGLLSIQQRELIESNKRRVMLFICVFFICWLPGMNNHQETHLCWPFFFNSQVNLMLYQANSNAENLMNFWEHFLIKSSSTKLVPRPNFFTIIIALLSIYFLYGSLHCCICGSGYWRQGLQFQVNVLCVSNWGMVYPPCMYSTVVV